MIIGLNFQDVIYGNARKIVMYFDRSYVQRLTRRSIVRGHAEAVYSEGRPNYKERQIILTALRNKKQFPFLKIYKVKK